MAGKNAWYLGSMFILLGLVAMAILTNNNKKKTTEMFQETTQLPSETGRYDGMLGVGENTYVTDKATVGGVTSLKDTTVNRNMTVSGGGTLKADVAANASVDIAQTLDIGGGWTVDGDLECISNAATGFLEVLRNADVKGYMKSSGLVVNDNLDTYGLTLQSGLVMGDEKKKQAALSIEKDVTAKSDMNVGGYVDISGTLDVNGAVEFGNESVFRNGESNVVTSGVEAGALNAGTGRLLLRNSVEAKGGVDVGKMATLTSGVVIGSNSSFGVNENGTNVINGESTTVNGERVCLNKHCLESTNIQKAKTLRERIIPAMNNVRQIIKNQVSAIKTQHRINAKALAQHKRNYDSHALSMAKQSDKVERTLNGAWKNVASSESDMKYIGTYNGNQDARITKLEEYMIELDGKFWGTVNME